MNEQEARERVAAAADRLFYTCGVQRIGMDAIRAASGVSLKRIYALYPSKDDLVSAVLTRRRRQWDKALAVGAAEATTPRERLMAVFDFLGEWFREDDFRGCAFVNAFGELGAGSPEVARLAREHKAAFQAYLTELVQAAGGPSELAIQLAMLAEGAQTTAAILGPDEVAATARRAAGVLVASALGERP